MPDLRIIYTSESDNFRLDAFEMISLRSPEKGLLQGLKECYEKLKQNFPDLPQQVGVVTYDDFFKGLSKNMLKEIDNPQSSYMPLDILEQVLKFEEVDLDNPLDRNYAYRALGRIVSHPAIILDDRLINNPTVLYSQTIPDFIHIKKLTQGALEKARKLDPETPDQNEIKKAHVSELEKLLGVFSEFPTFEDLRKVYENVKKSFEKNKVSREFPLYFSPPDSPPSLYSVSLVNKIETPEFLEGLMELLHAGCKASGFDKVPEKVQEEIDSLKRDMFGETKRADTLDELLSKLPEPKTIITDLYIADVFPELVKRGFEAYEFRLAN